MHEVGVPLGMKACTAGAGLVGHGAEVAQVFADQDGVGKALSQLAVDPLQQAPAVWQIVVAFAGHAADVQRHVHAQAVDAVLLHPHQGVVADELADLAAPVVRPGVAPGRGGAVVVVEVDPAAVVFAPAVKAPQVQIAGAEVVVDHVQDHRKALGMRLADKGLEGLGAAVNALYRKHVRRVVAPRVVAGKLGQGHDFNRVDAQRLQMRQALQRRRQRARRVGTRIERADVHLIDHQFVVRRRLEGVVAPIKTGRVHHHRTPDRVGVFFGVRVDAVEHLVATDQPELVLRTGPDLGHIDRPDAVVFQRHRTGVVVPAVEVSFDKHRDGLRRPDPEGGPLGVQHRTHPLSIHACFYLVEVASNHSSGRRHEVR